MPATPPRPAGRPSGDDPRQPATSCPGAPVFPEYAERPDEGRAPSSAQTAAARPRFADVHGRPRPTCHHRPRAARGPGTAPLTGGP